MPPRAEEGAEVERGRVDQLDVEELDEPGVLGDGYRRKRDLVLAREEQLEEGPGRRSRLRCTPSVLGPCAGEEEEGEIEEKRQHGGEARLPVFRDGAVLLR